MINDQVSGSGYALSQLTEKVFIWVPNVLYLKFFIA